MDEYLLKYQKDTFMTDFVSLHNQTSYSILDSIVSPKDLLLRAKELGQNAIAITDHGSIAAAWDGLKAAKETGVKLIIGCECYFLDDTSVEDFDKFRHIILLAKNAIGYKNLLTINKKGFDQGKSIGKKLYPVIDWKLLSEYAEGLICLTACGNGILSQFLSNGKFEKAEQALVKLKEIFQDNLGLEIQPNNMQRGSNIFNDKIDQKYLNNQLKNLGKKYNVRVVPACNTHYLKKEDSEVHDVLLSIGSHQPIYSNFRLKYPVSDFYLKSGQEVKDFFSRNWGEEYSQEICDNSVYFANLCEFPDWIDPKFSNPSGKELPVFPVKDELDYAEFLIWKEAQSVQNSGLEEDAAYLKYKCLTNFQKIKENILPNEYEEYMNRIENELSVIEYQGFSSYMLIVADYVNWAKKNNIPVGPGRGSGAGSIIGYLMGIHQADPIKYGLLFERFQTKGKKSAPDYDLDFGTKDRHKVIEYIINKYGKDYVAFISNFNTITPKVYVRDVSRACELGGSKEEAIKIGNNIADIIPKEIKNLHSLNEIPLYAEYIKKYPAIKDNESILNTIRNFSTHAAAIVIGKRPLIGLVPLRIDKENSISIECEKNTTEELGLVKMDLLGLSTLDIIEETIKLTKLANKIVPNIDYDLNDKKTYDLITKGDTYGVFQFGISNGTIDLCKRIKPKNIEDLAIITTLARPAAANIRNDFISARMGKKKVALLHPSLEGAFKKTYGFGLFDESILQLGKDVAGWDLNSADRIRKMIKEKNKNPEKDKKLRAEFIKDAIINNNIDAELATKIFDEEIKKFSNYTFNKSHAIVYSMLSYQTAYLKAHYPIEFLLANLMAEVNSNAPTAKSNIDKIKEELRNHKVKINPPNINLSQLTYTLSDDDNLLTGLDALKFVGEDAIQEILNKRPFNSFFDFMVRIDNKKVRANAIQALVASGCMDIFNIPRKLLFLYVSDYRKKLTSWLKKHDPNTEEFIYPWVNEKEWNIAELYALEQFYIGEAFICKPSEAYGTFFKGDHRTVEDINQIDSKKLKDKIRLSPFKGIIKDFFEFKIKKEGSKYYGQAMVKAKIEDKNGLQCDCTIFPEQWCDIQDKIKRRNSKATFDVGIAFNFIGVVNVYNENVGLILDDLLDIALPPPVPADLKAKKINLKESKAALIAEATQTKNIKDLVAQAEDILYEEGFIELDEDM